MKHNNAYNYRDAVSVTLGIVHNLGAGGVINNTPGPHAVGYVDIASPSLHRVAQWCRRTQRAGGHRE